MEFQSEIRRLTLSAHFFSERELIDEEEDLYDSVPEAEEGIYGCMIDIQPSLSVPKVTCISFGRVKALALSSAIANHKYYSPGIVHLANVTVVLVESTIIMSQVRLCIFRLTLLLPTIAKVEN